MRTVHLKSFMVCVESDEQAEKFLRALDLILDLYALPADQGAREYTLEVRENDHKIRESCPEAEIDESHL